MFVKSDTFESINVRKVIPLTDSTTALKVTKADGTTDFVTFDTTNMSVSVSGGIVATNINATSSKELKENIEEFKSEALEIINSVKIYSFNFISDPNNMKVGIIAEENPGLIAPTGKSQDITNTLNILLKAVQELDSKLNKLEERINGLTS